MVCVVRIDRFFFSQHFTQKTLFFFPVDTFKSNWDSDYRYSEQMDQNFFSVFAIFFPSGELNRASAFNKEKFKF